MYNVRTTVGTAEDADLISEGLVGGGFSACVHISKVHSVYRWRGVVEKGEEFLLEAKVPDGTIERAVSEIRRLHRYELPVIEWTKTESTPETERWINSESGNTP
jgi:periplasmic divalent cation tolerance protein